VVVGDVLYLPFKDQAFSTVCVSGVLHHLPHKLEEAFIELGRSSRKAICLIEPSITPSAFPLRPLRFFEKVYHWLFHTIVYNNRKDKYTINPIERPLNPKELVKLCSKNGLTISELKFYNHFKTLHKLLKYFPKLEKNLIHALISSSHGTHVEIIAEHVKNARDDCCKKNDT